MLKSLELHLPPSHVAEARRLANGAIEVKTWTEPSPVLAQEIQPISVEDKRGPRVVLLAPGSVKLDEVDKRVRVNWLLQMEGLHGLRLIDGGSLSEFQEIVRAYHLLPGARPSLLEFFRLCKRDDVVQQVCPHQDCGLPRCWLVEGFNHKRLGSELVKVGRPAVSERTIRDWLYKFKKSKPVWACELLALSVIAEESKVKAKRKGTPPSK